MDPSILNFFQQNQQALPTQNNLRQNIISDYQNANLQMPQVANTQGASGQPNPMSLFQPQMVGQGSGSNTNYLQSPQSYNLKSNMLLNNMLDATAQGYYGANRFVNQVPPPPIPSQQQLQQMMNSAVQNYNQSQGGNAGRGGGGYTPRQIPDEFDARDIYSDEWDEDIARALGVTEREMNARGSGYVRSMRHMYLKGNEEWFPEMDSLSQGGGRSGGGGMRNSAPPQLPQQQQAPRVSYSGGQPSQPPQLPGTMQQGSPMAGVTKPYQATWQDNQQAWVDWLNNQANGTGGGGGGMPNDLWSWFNSAGVYTPPVRGYDPSKPRTYWYEDYLGNAEDEEGEEDEE
jgi:hypothetical protein